MRILKDGTLILPHRGKEPKSIEGFEKVRPYVFRPIMKKCRYRYFIEKDCCGGSRKASYMYCSFFGEEIVVSRCSECLDSKE
jgi:hypothetical protein